MVGSYKRILDIRMEAIVKYVKIKMEMEKVVKAKVRFSWMRTLLKIGGYSMLVMFLVGLLLPPYIMNYVR